MTETMTHMDAWKDFWKAKHDLPTWRAMSRKEKAPAYMANKAYNDKDKTLTPSRVEALLRKYAPDRYNFNLVITLKQP